MDGVICINKPKGFTSFDVVAKCRGILREKKIGHSGTLDPMATGVLTLFLGKATSAADLVPIQKKRYTANMRLGIITDTYDTTGKILEQNDCEGITLDAVRDAVKNFEGCITQIPPAYSAVKVGGQRLYDIARSGQTVKAPPRTVFVEKISAGESGGEFFLDIICSRGTYVRSIINDLGKILGRGAAMSGLVRTECSGFTLFDCVTIETLQNYKDNNDIQKCLRPLTEIFLPMRRINMNCERVKYFINGSESNLEGDFADGIYAVWTDGEFLGLGEVRDGVCYTKKVYCERSEVSRWL